MHTHTHARTYTYTQITAAVVFRAVVGTQTLSQGALTQRSINHECESTKAKLILLLAPLHDIALFVCVCVSVWVAEGIKVLTHSQGNHIRNTISSSSCSSIQSYRLKHTPLFPLLSLPGSCGKKFSKRFIGRTKCNYRHSEHK